MQKTNRIDKDLALKIFKGNPLVSYENFKEKYGGEISKRYFYNLRADFLKESAPYKKPRKSNKKISRKKRKYTKSGLYSKKVYKHKKGSLKERRAYNKTTTCLILWSKDTSKLRLETMEVLHELVRSVVKSKKMDFELVETLVPPRLELREYSR